MPIKRSCFQVIATDEQIEYTHKIVEYSLKHHFVPNIWDADAGKKDRTNFYRFIGSLGEVVFADVYNLPRHKKSFGAVDGQDYGNDFEVKINNKFYKIDLKSMHRQSDNFKGYYVLNVPARQLGRSETITDLYYCVSIHEANKQYIVSFLGFINKKDIISGEIGIFYKAGTVRTRADETTFKFFEDTYEVDFKDFTPPQIKEEYKKLKGFKLISIN